MKSIMISIKPEWVERILSGEKTIEIRKTMPKCKLPCRVFIYCTKSQKGNVVYAKNNIAIYHESPAIIIPAFLWFGNGQVIAEFTLNKVDTYYYDQDYYHDYDNFYIYYITHEQFQKTCLSSYEELEKYGNEKTLYGWHIDDLKVYDQPKELSQFGLKRAPQSWCYCEVVK